MDGLILNMVTIFLVSRLCLRDVKLQILPFLIQILPKLKKIQNISYTISALSFMKEREKK